MNELPGLGQQGPDMKRLLIAALLTLLLFIPFNYFFSQKLQPQKPEPQAPKPELSTPAEAPAPLAAALPMGTATEALPLQMFAFEALGVSKDEKEPIGIRSGYQAEVSNHGGALSKLTLTGYQPQVGLLLGEGARFFGLESANAQMTLSLDASYELVKKDDRHLELSHLTPEGLKVVRRYTFSEDQFLIHHEIEVQNPTSTPKSVALDMSLKTGAKKAVSSGWFGSQPSEGVSVVYHQAEATQRFSFAELEKEDKKVAAPIGFVGFDQHYFLTALYADQETALDGLSAQAAPHAGDLENEVVHVKLKPAIIEPLKNATWSVSAYVGPKQLHLLRDVGHELDSTINFGWFGVISRPLLWLLIAIFGFVGNFGWAIILLTVLIKILTFPLTQKSFVSMQEMKKVSPELKALQKKYGHDRTQLAQKQMELYRQHGINPMAGCLPLLLQMPIWFALYQMLSNAVELYQRPFMGWLVDLTQPDPYYVLPILMGVSMLVQQSFQPTPEDQPQMKYVMWAMPIFFTFIMLSMPSGLSLYIFTNNILTLAQQLYIKYRFKDPKPIAV